MELGRSCDRHRMDGINNTSGRVRHATYDPLRLVSHFPSQVWRLSSDSKPRSRVTQGGAVWIDTREIADNRNAWSSTTCPRPVGLLQRTNFWTEERRHLTLTRSLRRQRQNWASSPVCHRRYRIPGLLGLLSNGGKALKEMRPGRAKAVEERNNDQITTQMR